MTPPQAAQCPPDCLCEQCLDGIPDIEEISSWGPIYPSPENDPFMIAIEENQIEITCSGEKQELFNDSLEVNWDYLSENKHEQNHNQVDISDDDGNEAAKHGLPGNGSLPADAYLCASCRSQMGTTAGTTPTKKPRVGRKRRSSTKRNLDADRKVKNRSERKRKTCPRPRPRSAHARRSKPLAPAAMSI